MSNGLFILSVLGGIVGVAWALHAPSKTARIKNNLTSAPVKSLPNSSTAIVVPQIISQNPIVDSIIFGADNVAEDTNISSNYANPLDL